MQLPLRMGLLLCLSSHLGCDETMPIRGDRRHVPNPHANPIWGPMRSLIDHRSRPERSGFTDPVQNLDAAPIDTGMPEPMLLHWTRPDRMPRDHRSGHPNRRTHRCLQERPASTVEDEARGVNSFILKWGGYWIGSRTIGCHWAQSRWQSGQSIEFAIACGGRLEAVTANGQSWWRSPVLDITQVHGCGFDGDGRSEILALAPRTLFIFDAYRCSELGATRKRVQ